MFTKETGHESFKKMKDDILLMTVKHFNVFYAY